MTITAADLHALARDLGELDEWLRDPNHATDGDDGITLEQLEERVHGWAVEADLAEARQVLANAEPKPEVTCTFRLEAPKLSKRERSALEIYVFDPAHEAEPFPGAIEDGALVAHDYGAGFAPARQWLTEAANSADAAGDALLRDALTSLASRLPRF